MDCDRVKIYRITDFLTPLIIMNNQVLKDAIYEDGVDCSIPDVVNEYWLGASIDDRTFACFRFVSMSSATLQIHPMVLPEFRAEFAHLSTMYALKWCAESIVGLNTIVALIPKCHRNVILFARHMKFKHVGDVPKSYRRKGELIDTTIYSISVDRIKSL